MGSGYDAARGGAQVRVEGCAMLRRQRKHAITGSEPTPPGAVGEKDVQVKFKRFQATEPLGEWHASGGSDGISPAPNELLWLGPSHADRLGPFALGFQHQLDHFAHRARPARPLRDELSRPPHLGHGVGDSNGETYSCQHGQVGQVIPHIRHVRVMQTGAVEDFTVGAELFLRGLIHEIHLEFPRAPRDRGGTAPGDQARSQASQPREFESGAIVSTEHLHFCSGAIRQRLQVDVAVGEHAIHIHQEEPDARGTPPERRRNPS